MPRIGILTGLKREAACLASLENAADAPLVRLSAARCERGQAMAEELGRAQVLGLVSFGFAGGLVSEMKEGMLALPAEVVDTSGGRWPVDVGWRSALAEHAPSTALVDTVVGVNEVQMTPEAKSMIRSRTTASICDMESHHVGRAAHEAGLPFIVVRTVLDSHDTSLPRWAAFAINDEGGVGVAAVTFGAVTHVQDWLKLARLGAVGRSAAAELRRLVAAAGPLLGFPRL